MGHVSDSPARGTPAGANFTSLTRHWDFSGVTISGVLRMRKNSVPEQGSPMWV